MFMSKSIMLMFFFNVVVCIDVIIIVYPDDYRNKNLSKLFYFTSGSNPVGTPSTKSENQNQKQISPALVKVCVAASHYAWQCCTQMRL
jgi:hypothetical protein